jgi:hypothetical protein
VARSGPRELRIGQWGPRLDKLGELEPCLVQEGR